MLVVVAPGQGSQTPGFLTPWLEIDGVKQRLQWLSAVSGVDLIEHGTNSDADTIRDTAIAQPLLVGAGLITLLTLFPRPSEAFSRIGAGAGHSVGEITAAAGAGVLSAEQAMVFVRERGRAMAAAAKISPTGMAAVLGGSEHDVIASAETAGLTCANINAAGQIVVAGTREQIESFMAAPPERARIRPLQVAGAFHTEHMRSAVNVLTGYGQAMSTHDSRIRLISNADGQVVRGGREVLRRMINQVSNPVRWDKCMATMADLGVTALLEIPPAGTLTGIAKRALPGVETLAVNTPDDLPAAWDLIARHGSPASTTDLASAPTWRLVVSPAKGTFTRSITEEAGAPIAPGTTIGIVTTLQDSFPVTAPYGGTVTEWVAEHGDPVSPGQPLLRLHQEDPL